MLLLRRLGSRLVLLGEGEWLLLPAVSGSAKVHVAAMVYLNIATCSVEGRSNKQEKDGGSLVIATGGL
jgi:hypothetical protein